MKIRCVSQSIRIRVRRSELSQLMADIHLEEVLDFGPNSLTYRLSVAKKMEKPTVTYDIGLLSVSIPSALAKTWGESNQVGIEYHLEINPGQNLHLLIEKDFPCQTRPDEPKEDFFSDLQQQEPESC